MCYQTSDVTVCSRSMLKLTLVHAVISFVDMAAILGLVINLPSNEISNDRAKELVKNNALGIR